MFFSEKIRSLYLKNNSRWSLMTTLPKTEKKHNEAIKPISFKKESTFLEGKICGEKEHAT